jgi:hypothetical protein
MIARCILPSAERRTSMPAIPRLARLVSKGLRTEVRVSPVRRHVSAAIPTTTTQPDKPVTAPRTNSLVFDARGALRTADRSRPSQQRIFDPLPSVGSRSRGNSLGRNQSNSEASSAPYRTGSRPASLAFLSFAVGALTVTPQPRSAHAARACSAAPGPSRRPRQAPAPAQPAPRPPAHADCVRRCPRVRRHEPAHPA